MRRFFFAYYPVDEAGAWRAIECLIRLSVPRRDKTLRAEEKFEFLKAMRDLDKMTQELRQMSRNLWWTWSPDAQEIFAELSPLVWTSSNHNAISVLNSLSHQELKARLMEKDFAKRAADVLVQFREYLTRDRTWCSGGNTIRDRNSLSSGHRTERISSCRRTTRSPIPSVT